MAALILRVTLLWIFCFTLLVSARLVGHFLPSHQLAFASSAPDGSSRQVTIVDVDRGLRCRLPVNLQGNFSISPQHMLVFLGEGNNINTSDLYGNNQHVLSNIGYSLGIFEPTWHPDGSVFAFASDDLSLVGQRLYLGNGDDVEEAAMEQSFDSMRGLAWSPDGLYIAFTAREGFNSPSAIYLLTISSGEIQKLTPDDMLEAGQPSWSPDGRYLTFWGEDQDTTYDIFIMDVHEGTLRNLTQDSARDGAPSWSPDGTQLVFISSQVNNTDIYVMDMDGGNVRRLTDNPEPDVYPVWSPDGGYIAFRSGAPIHVMRPDGSERRVVADQATLGYSLLWLP